LAATPRGVALLEVLGYPQPSWLPGGKPNLLGLSKRVAAGQLDVEDIAALFARRPWGWLRSPESLLLPAAAAWREQPEQELRFFNRFLRWHGVSALQLEPGRAAGNVLEHFRARQARARRGPLVSVLVAARNAQETLGYALDSLLSQTHSNLELLVADDASSDGTLEVLRRYSHERRLRAFSSPENQGAYNIRNALAARARGKYLTFHDADDFALPERIEAQICALSAQGACATATGLLRLRTDGSVVFFKDHHALRLCRASLLLRRETFWALGGFRQARFGADEELHIKLRAVAGPGAIARVAAPLVLSLWSPASATRLRGSESLEDGFRSPARRAYSELSFRKYIAGHDISEQELDDQLRALGNHLEPKPLVALDGK
jgi:hypothetical protein